MARNAMMGVHVSFPSGKKDVTWSLWKRCSLCLLPSTLLQCISFGKMNDFHKFHNVFLIFWFLSFLVHFTVSYFVALFFFFFLLSYVNFPCLFHSKAAFFFICELVNSPLSLLILLSLSWSYSHSSFRTWRIWWGLSRCSLSRCSISMTGGQHICTTTVLF